MPRDAFLSCEMYVAATYGSLVSHVRGPMLVLGVRADRFLTPEEQPHYDEFRNMCARFAQPDSVNFHGKKIGGSRGYEDVNETTTVQRKSW